MADLGATIRRSPLSWLGVRFPYKMKDEWKSTVHVSAWDGDTKTWWCPENYFPFVVTMLQKNGVHLDVEKVRANVCTTFIATLDAAQAEREAARRIQPAAPEGVTAADLIARYKLLGLDPSCPDGVLDAAFAYLVRSNDLIRGVGGPAMLLLEVETAYREICASRGRG